MNEIEIPRLLDINVFYRWVEQTSLFETIVQLTHRPDMAGISKEIRSEQISFSLKAGIVINKAQDLPKELLLEFFLNSPFYKQNNNDNQQNKLIWQE